MKALEPIANWRKPSRSLPAAAEEKPSVRNHEPVRPTKTPSPSTPAAALRYQHAAADRDQAIAAALSALANGREA